MKKDLLMLVLIMALPVVVWQGVSSSNKKPNDIEADNLNVVKNNILILGAGSGKLTGSKIPDSGQQSIDAELSDQDMADISEGYSDSIHRSDFSNSDYGTYDVETLERLVDAGDVTAMKALQLKYLNTGNPENVAKQYALVEKAVIYGDRGMFQYMLAFSQLQTSLGNPDLTEDQKKEIALDYLAHKEFVGMRGNLAEKYSGVEIFFKLYPQIYSNSGKSLTLSDVDKLQIKERAEQIYKYYENERKNMGLGEFDNSISEGMKKNFDHQREIYLNELGDNAI